MYGGSQTAQEVRNDHFFIFRTLQNPSAIDKYLNWWGILRCCSFSILKWIFSQKKQLNICFLVTETWCKKLIVSILEDDKSKSQFIRVTIREKIK
jgi:hypothetical protein